jgi:hypothetical protein
MELMPISSTDLDSLRDFLSDRITDEANRLEAGQRQIDDRVRLVQIEQSVQGEQIRGLQKRVYSVRDGGDGGNEGDGSVRIPVGRGRPSPFDDQPVTFGTVKRTWIVGAALVGGAAGFIRTLYWLMSLKK